MRNVEEILKTVQKTGVTPKDKEMSVLSVAGRIFWSCDQEWSTQDRPDKSSVTEARENLEQQDPYNVVLIIAKRLTTFHRKIHGMFAPAQRVFEERVTIDLQSR